MANKEQSQPIDPTMPLYTISIVAEKFAVHPQTLRLYEREGLVKPQRSQGNTRLYSEDDLICLEFLLNLTRDLGVNLAGVDIIMRLKKDLDRLRYQFAEVIAFIQDYLAKHDPELAEKLVRALEQQPHSDVIRTMQRDSHEVRSDDV